MELARWARRQGASVVVGSAFESAVGLASYAHLAAALDSGRFLGAAAPPPLDHGLATHDRFSADVVQQGLSPPLRLAAEGAAGGTPHAVMGLPESAALLQAACDDARLNPRVLHGGWQGSARPAERRAVVRGEGGWSVDFRLLEQPAPPPGDPGAKAERPVLLLLHGFLGCSEDWEPVMAALSHSFRVVALDLPGHGGTSVSWSEARGGNGTDPFAMECVAAAVAQVATSLAPAGGCTPVGYSLGGRLALYLAAAYPQQVCATACNEARPHFFIFY